MPLTAEQTALFAQWRFDYVDDIKAVDHLVELLTAREAAAITADAAYAAAGLGGARTDPVWGTTPMIERGADTILKQEQWRTILNARETFAAGASIGRSKLWSTVKPLITSHTTVVVTSLDGTITFEPGEEVPVPGAPELVTMTGDYVLRLVAETAYPNQNLLVATPDRLPGVVRVIAP